MDKKKFWALIDDARQKAEGDPEVQAELLEEALQALDPEEIAGFQDVFEEYHARADKWDLWGAAYIIGGGCSDDGFDYFRCWLIGKGEAVYEAALANAESLVDHVTDIDLDCGCECESLAYAAMDAWEHKTGKSSEEMPRSQGVMNGGTQGEDWKEEDLPKRFPRLWNRFAEEFEENFDDADEDEQ